MRECGGPGPLHQLPSGSEAALGRRRRRRGRTSRRARGRPPMGQVCTKGIERKATAATTMRAMNAGEVLAGTGGFPNPRPFQLPDGAGVGVGVPVTSGPSEEDRRCSSRPPWRSGHRGRGRADEIPWPPPGEARRSCSRTGTRLAARWRLQAAEPLQSGGHGRPRTPEYARAFQASAFCPRVQNANSTLLRMYVGPETKMQSPPSELPCHITQSAEWKNVLRRRFRFPQTQFVTWNESVRTPRSHRPNCWVIHHRDGK